MEIEQTDWNQEFKKEEESLKEKAKLIRAKKQLEHNLNQCRKLVVEFFLRKERNEATEAIVSFFSENFHIYTTKDDNNPEIWIYDGGIYVPNGRTTIKKITRAILGPAYTTHLANEVVNKIEAQTYIKPTEFFQNDYPTEVAVENGVLDVLTGKLSDFEPEKVFFNKLPVRYDATAICPMIVKFIKDIVKDPENDLGLIQEIFGWCLLKEYKFEKSIMLSGGGRNGKGKFLELFKYLLGPENCTNIPLQTIENDKFAISELLNKMVNLGGDMSSETLKTTNRFRGLTGRDLMTADRKFRNPVNFINFAKMIFCCNELPRTYDKEDAFWMRWVFIEFPYKFVNKEELENVDEEYKKWFKLCKPDIIESIITPEELSGLLNWALEGLERLEKKGDFSFSQTTAQVKEWWIRKTDSLKAFAMDCLETDWNSMIEKKEFRKFYALYCQYYKLRMLNDRNLKEALSAEFGVIDEKVSIGNTRPHCWVGIKFKNSEVFKDFVAVQGVQGVLGISTYSQIFSLAIGVNTQDSLDSPKKTSYGESANQLNLDDIGIEESELESPQETKVKRNHLEETKNKIRDYLGAFSSNPVPLVVLEKYLKSKGQSGDDLMFALDNMRKEGEVLENPSGEFSLV